MSCSQFIEHEDEDKSDTLVIIVNGDGTVTVDPSTLERVLSNQCRAAVSVIRKLEDSDDEPDSQTEKVRDKNEKSSDEKDSSCHKVNLVVEGYYPPPPLNSNSKSMSSDSVVSSTVGTPPLPQTSSEFFDLLAEGLEIPESQSNTQTSLEGCVGDSLVDAFSEMAPEQLKQVETALHSEKAKQILGDGVSYVLDTLKIGDNPDDWIHFDHCYTVNCYGNRKQMRIEHNQEPSEKQPSSEKESTVTESGDMSGIDDIYETLSDLTGDDVQKTDSENALTTSKKKSDVEGKARSSSKKTVLADVKFGQKRSPIHIISKVKKKSSKNDLIESTVPERIVKDDEVDGVKVFKPTKSDKRLPKSLSLKDLPLSRTTLVQTKLNFGVKEEGSSPAKKPPSAGDSDISTPKLAGKNGATKKDTARKPVAPEIFGPALFSTPDIIRKIGSDDTPKESCNISSIDTAELEKRMSAIENGEVLENVTLPYVEPKPQKIEEKMPVQDDSRLLSDLENSADELTRAEEIVVGLSNSLSDHSCRRKSTESEQSDFSDKNDVEYEDDPNKLWCICNKPHNNRFMICCDACDNWFHGYCVGITKAMGEKMEQNGTEWLCPSCKKEKSATERDSKQKLATRSLANRNTTKRRNSQTAGDSSNSNVSTSSTPTVEAPSSLQQSTVTEKASENQATHVAAAANAVNRRPSTSLPLKISSSTQLCNVCRENEAMPESLYCGNTCIVRYVAESVENMSNMYTEPLPDDQKIIVHDRKKQQTITGMRGPSVSELPRWLADHPSFEIVKPSAFPIRPQGRELKLKPVPSESLKTPVKTKDPQTFVVSKPKQAPTVKTKSSGEANESSQTSLKQFFADKSKIKKSVDTASNVTVKEGSASKLGEQRKDLHTKLKDKDKDKEKQRQIKLIPAQSEQKPAEETRSDTASVTKTSITLKVPSPSPVSKKPIVQTSLSAEKSEKTSVKRKSEPPKKEKPSKKPTEIKRQDSKKNDDDLTTAEAPTESSADARERIRKSCRIALNELFISRMKDVNDINVREDELTTLANQVEDELFNLFNDTNTKYKSKYRSLRFNIKDQKNTLFRRIAERSLRPYDLVRLTPEELASTELAQWREREAKHEIDMIKKTELENLNQTKVLVLKTHKGELEIESEALPTAPDTVVPDLHDELPVEADKSKKSLTLKLKTSLKAKDSSKDVGKKDRDKDRHKKHDHKDKHKSSSSHKRRHRSSERHGSRSRKRSKSKEGRESGKNADKKDHRSSKSSTDKKHDIKSSSDKDRHRSRHRSRSRSRRKEKTPEEKKEETSPLTMDAGEASKNESLSDAPVEKRKNTIIINKEDEKIAAELLSSYNTVDVDLSDMEPTSTVTIQTPPYAASPELPSVTWKGTLIMPDVIKLHTRLREVSGRCEGLDEDLPATIDCVGRINPQMVWDYISKTKKTGNREILVLRFEPVDDEQQANYFTLYSYLNRKDRMAVVGKTSPSIKDFYVIPLAGHSPIPQVLLPLDGPGFEDSRSHMLLGVIVRSRRHNHHNISSLLQSSHPLVKKEKETFIQPSVPFVAESQIATQSDTFTPPHSPTSAMLGGLPKSPPITVPGNDDDEPYSPEDDEPYSPGALDEEHENDTSLDIQREMEALNRQIEEQKQQIESISSSLPQEEREEFYSPTEHFGGESDASNVQLPGDLQQLLNSLNRRSSEAPLTMQTDPIVDAYKQHVEISDDDVEEVEDDLGRGEDKEEKSQPCFSPPDVVKEMEADLECEVKNEEELEDTLESSVEEIPIPADPPEPIDDSRLNRDPRRKMVPVQSTVEPFRMLTPSQPPPPGMEDEFPISGGANSEGGTPTSTDAGVVVTMVPVTMSDAAYVTAVPTTPYMYGTNAPLTAFPPPNMMPAVPQMYIPAPGVFPQATALPFAPVPPQQLYITPAAVLPTDPSMIPLPVEPNEMKNVLKRKSQEDDRDKDRDRRASGGKSRKYYRDSKSPPGRDGYDSHYRGYRRSDDRDSRYGSSRHDRSYNRSRSGYWKSSGDYSSSTRRNRYSDRDRDSRRSRSRSSSRERSSSKHSNRWDSASKHGKDDWDEGSDSQKRDKMDRKSDSSSRRSRS